MRRSSCPNETLGRVTGALMFQFATAAQIVFGAGALSQLTSLVQGLGRRAWLVLGESDRLRERV
jgi:hypothetical protein